jgi:hypothetical protein
MPRRARCSIATGMRPTAPRCPELAFVSRPDDHSSRGRRRNAPGAMSNASARVRQEQESGVRSNVGLDGPAHGGNAKEVRRCA